uniref:Uncharacterized protein n=1 Tax=Anguilla anguilla TaxID=7936 RepID=A0A0E9U228_ANGAN
MQIHCRTLNDRKKSGPHGAVLQMRG